MKDLNNLTSGNGDGASSSQTSSWNKGGYDSPQSSLEDHFDRHGTEVGADNAEQYLRKAESFKQNLRGSTKSNVDGIVEGVVMYKKNSKYIDLAPDGTIVSFGKQ